MNMNRFPSTILRWREKNLDMRKNYSYINQCCIQSNPIEKDYSIIPECLSMDVCNASFLILFDFFLSIFSFFEEMDERLCERFECETK